MAIISHSLPKTGSTGIIVWNGKTVSGKLY